MLEYHDCLSHCPLNSGSKDARGSSEKTASIGLRASSSASLGSIQASTNLALPSSYDFNEYVFAEPDDEGVCNGVTNSSAVIEAVFLSQTHRHRVGDPLMFTIGYRPALLQIAVSGSGESPDVQVEGILDGTPLGVLCLAGPAILPSSGELDLTVPAFADYFSVTLPKAWLQPGLELIVTADAQTQTISSSELNIGPYTEMNLVMVNMDFMDYNTGPHQTPVFDDFLEEMASSIPASVVRFGIFPETLVYPEVIATDGTEQLVRVQSKTQVDQNPSMDGGHINSIAVLSAANMHVSTHDYLSTVYFGNTLNLAPGGWGGGRSFVSFDFTDVFIHELGHALSLPHWGSVYDQMPNSNHQYNYPFGGEMGNGGGRGQTWNFIQDTYEFVSPTCSDGGNSNFGLERSDCMQRNHPCLESRPSGLGPWDGHGVFSAYAMHRYLIGDFVETGQVMDNGQLKDYQLPEQNGFPTMSLVNQERVYTRDPIQPQSLDYHESRDMPGDETLNTDVYLIYGTAHPTQPQANIVYKPIKYNGTLPPVVDPTDPDIFAQLKIPNTPNHIFDPKDITLKVTYVDGSELHVLNPFHSYVRPPYVGGYHVFRYDLSNFSIVVPGDLDIEKVEVFNRPFCVRDEFDDTEGNINYAPHNITAANFMNDADLLSTYTVGDLYPPLTAAIGNKIWHDYDRDGINDPNEPGIPGVTVAHWVDSDGDDIPDFMGGFHPTTTDEDGVYRFEGLDPGVYSIFVWSVNNWDVGQPLHGFESTPIFEPDPNTDINLDNSGTGGAFSDIFSGIVHLSLDAEPLDDGDPEDCWFDSDQAGNMTVDFGFYDPRLFAWIGVEDTEWENVNNWAGGVVPNPTSEVIILSGRQFYPVIDEDVSIMKLEVQDGATMDVQDDFMFQVLSN